MLSLLATSGGMYINSIVGSNGSQASQHRQNSPLLAAKSRFSYNREVCATLPVAFDRDVEYAIIPCTLEPGFWGAFTLTAYSVEVYKDLGGGSEGNLEKFQADCDSTSVVWTES